MRLSPSSAMHTTEDMMARSQVLEVQEKKELVSKEEKTAPARYYVPTTDIYETEATGSFPVLCCRTVR